MQVLGIDASTTTVGWSIVESDDMSLVAIGHWSLKKFESLMTKADHVVQQVNQLVLSYDKLQKTVWIEEPVIMFTPGMSSAQTISKLVGFNAMVSYGIYRDVGDRNKFAVRHVKPGDARRSCGIVLTTKAKSGGMSQKEQTMQQLTSSSGYLSSVVFTKTKSGKHKPENFDEADAYVIARYGASQAARDK